jgi:hypothetical protein
MKNMKTIIKTTALASFLLPSMLVFNGCNEEKSINLNVTPVKQLYEPADGKSVELQSSASAALYFEWEPAKAEDGGMVLYEIAFDRENGDFSKPVYRMASENNGGRNYVTITHKQLNKIAGMLGIESAETGRFKWTIFASKGLNDVKGEVIRTLEIKRLQGFDEIPVDVYITGEASEGGTTLADALLFKMVNPGEFEIYTHLTTGKTYYFVDKKEGASRRFYADGNILRENETGTSSVDATGVYKVELDFNTGGVAYNKITSMGIFHCEENRVIIPLAYTGNGVWSATDCALGAIRGDWGNARYKIEMESDAGKSWWVTVNETDSPPGSSPNPNYYYVRETSAYTQWDNKWKINGEFTDATFDASVTLNASGPYTHIVTRK